MNSLGGGCLLLGGVGCACGVFVVSARCREVLSHGVPSLAFLFSFSFSLFFTASFCLPYAFFCFMVRARPFTLLLRRHHCRMCGELVCGQCSPHRVRLTLGKGTGRGGGGDDDGGERRAEGSRRGSRGNGGRSGRKK